MTSTCATVSTDIPSYEAIHGRMPLHFPSSISVVAYRLLVALSMSAHSRFSWTIILKSCDLNPSLDIRIYVANPVAKFELEYSEHMIFRKFSGAGSDILSMPKISIYKSMCVAKRIRLRWFCTMWYVIIVTLSFNTQCRLADHPNIAPSPVTDNHICNAYISNIYFSQSEPADMCEGMLIINSDASISEQCQTQDGIAAGLRSIRDLWDQVQEYHVSDCDKFANTSEGRRKVWLQLGAAQNANDIPGSTWICRQKALPRRRTAWGRRRKCWECQHQVWEHLNSQ